MDWVAAGSVLVAIIALLVQWRAHRGALAAQQTENREGREQVERLAAENREQVERLAEAERNQALILARQDREHALTLAREDRVWARRAEVYAQLLEAMRQHIEEGGEQYAAEDHRLTRLAT